MPDTTAFNHRCEKLNILFKTLWICHFVLEDHLRNGRKLPLQARKRRLLSVEVNMDSARGSHAWPNCSFLCCHHWLSRWERMVDTILNKSKRRALHLGRSDRVYRSKDLLEKSLQRRTWLFWLATSCLWASSVPLWTRRLSWDTLKRTWPTGWGRWSSPAPLPCWVHIWNTDSSLGLPGSKKTRNLLEWVLWKVTKIIKGLKHLPYEEWLRPGTPQSEEETPERESCNCL